MFSVIFQAPGYQFCDLHLIIDFIKLVVTNAPNMAGSVPLLSSPYVDGNKNEPAAEHRACVMAWTSKPDKATDHELHLKWKEDIQMWNHRGDAPLNFAPNPNTKEYTSHAPSTTSQDLTSSSQPFCYTICTKSTIITSHQESTNVIDLEPEPVPKATTPVAPPVAPAASLDDVIEECIKKYGDEAVLFWFAKKVDLSEEIRRVGRYVPSTYSSDPIVSLTQSMVESLYKHRSVFDPNSEKEVDARVRLIRKFKSLVAHSILYPSSSDKGKKRAFNQD
ncbi:uncharacterized protein MELLADRAFT_93600 [Melampsora larici-populina 98AG31]|uniref:Uncharacterized protein n=1 Tax=Melampsora larici-populina (strain 98AG31 / pathotype 3-4-7) TaxID=747676 RepID=F4RB11_MELLP|nr:uncharacterized protein MELLADRAFT_93600 [Melampsora larici-populina 98AG31]EGG10567.1 hypothetical protein MELLADRAFT_93600 [Melampsora larici-populina 98AG31]